MVEINDIWSLDWVVVCLVFVCFFIKDRFWVLWINIYLVDNEKVFSKESLVFDKFYKVRFIMKIFGKFFKENFNFG